VNPGAANNDGFSGHQLWYLQSAARTLWSRISTPLGFLGSLGRGMEPSIIKQGSAEAGE
jgi:hypothetical protein